MDIFQVNGRRAIIILWVTLGLAACVGIRNEFNTINFTTELDTEVPILLLEIAAGDTIPADTVITVIRPMVYQNVPFFIDTLNLSTDDIDQILPDEVTFSTSSSTQNFNFLREVEIYLSPSSGGAQELLVAFLDTIPRSSLRTLTLISEPVNMKDMLFADSLVNLRAVMTIREEIQTDLTTNLNLLFEISGEQD